MNKREPMGKAAQPVEPAEEEIAIGSLVQYYRQGYRYGHVEAMDLDDDAEIILNIRPIAPPNARLVKDIRLKDVIVVPEKNDSSRVDK